MAFSPARRGQDTNWHRGVRHRGFALRSRSVELIRGKNHFGDSVRLRIDSHESTPQPKIFCIGMNKTGTTSLAVAAKKLGISCGDQRIGELIFRSPFVRTRTMTKYIESAGFFQDVPFSLTPTSLWAMRDYPDAKFILSIRSSPDVWYQSYVNFYSKLVGLDPDDISWSILRTNRYRSAGFLYKLLKTLNPHAAHPFEQASLCTTYEHHCAKITLLADRLGVDLLKLCVEDADAGMRLSKFLGFSPTTLHELPRANQRN